MSVLKSLLRKVAVPDVGVSIPTSMFNVVVLPAPLCPNRAKI